MTGRSLPGAARCPYPALTKFAEGRWGRAFSIRSDGAGGRSPYPCMQDAADKARQTATDSHIQRCRRVSLTTRPVTDDDIAPSSGPSIRVIPRPDAVRRAYSSLDDREPSSCGQGCRASWDSSVEAHPFPVCPVFRGAAAGRCPSSVTGGLRRLTGARSRGHAHGGLSAAEVSAVLPAIV